jgi:PAS domain S-box-containing protein
MSSRSHRILIVDDEASIRELLACALGADDREIETTACVDDALELIERNPVDLVITDLRMPGRSGEDLVEVVTRDHPETLVVIMTGYPSFDSALQALRAGVVEYIQKPFSDIDRIDRLIRDLLRRQDDTRRRQTSRLDMMEKVRSLENERRVLFRRVNLVKRNLREQIKNLERSREAYYLDLSRVMTIIDNIVDGIVFTDLDGKIILINPSAGEQLGLHSFAALGKSFGEIQGHRDLLRVLDRNHARAVEGEGHRSNVEFWTPEGEKRVYAVYTTPVRSFDDGMTGILSILQDVTLQRKTEELKNQFLSIVAHELRTPLTGIKSFSSVLKKEVFGALNEKQAELIENIVLQSDRLGHEIDKIINLGRLESEDFIPEKELVPIESLFRGLAAPFQLELQNKDLTFEIQTKGCDVPVFADRRDVRRAIQALLENAIKFTPPGGEIDLSACRIGARIEIGVIREVHAAGKPADPPLRRLGPRAAVRGPDRERARVRDSTRERRRQGLSLLLRARDPAIERGGPVLAGRNGPHRGRGRVMTMSKKILIVDDEKLILISTKIVLESVGYEVLTAVSGEEGIEVCRRETPALVLLDIMMPGIDGWETLSRLKCTPETSEIPVIIFTAREHSRGKQLAREMGAADYFPKPFEPDELISIVEEYAVVAQP